MRFFAIASVLFTAAVGVIAGPVVERDTTSSVATVLTTLQNNVAPYVSQLHALTTESATQATVQPISDNISAAVQVAITDLQKLKGQSTNVIMASVDGTTTLSSSDIASLLCSVLSLILSVIGEVLSLVSGDLYTTLCALFTTLGQLLCTLVSVVGSLVGGVLALLLILLLPVLSILDVLGITGILEGILGGLL